MSVLAFPGAYESRPRRLAVAAQHPSVYDHTAEPPDVPELPLKVQLALTALTRYVEAPGTITREQAQEAAAWVHAWRAGFDMDAPEPQRDDCPPRGLRRLL